MIFVGRSKLSARTVEGKWWALAEEMMQKPVSGSLWQVWASWRSAEP